MNRDVEALDNPFPPWVILALPFIIIGLLAAFVFPIAGDWRWLEAWILIITLSVSIPIGYGLINERKPRVLRSCLKKERENFMAAPAWAVGPDRWIIPLLSLALAAALILPAGAHRLGFQVVPAWLSIAGVAGVNIGVWIITRAMLVNEYALMLDVVDDQKLVDDGPYARVRHPLYSGAILMMLALPPALGSYLALIPSGMAALLIVIRIRFEEERLVERVPGYADYRARVRHRLIPGAF